LRRSQRPRIGHLDPQAQHFAVEFVHAVVFKFIARVQHRVIVGKLQITGLEHHAQAEIVAVHDLVKQIERFNFNLGQRQVADFVAQLDVLAQVAAAELALVVAEDGRQAGLVFAQVREISGPAPSPRWESLRDRNGETSAPWP
jgi:hypothetical protein